MSRATARHRSGPRLALALAGLTGMAVSEPVLGLLGKQASFFIAHRLDRLDLVLFVVAVGVAVPALPALAALAAGTLGDRVRAWVGGSLMALLAALQVLALLRTLDDPLPGVAALQLAVATGLVTVWAWSRSRRFGDGLALLVGIVPLAAGIFVWQTASAGLWQPAAAAESAETAAGLPAPARPASPPPIVWLVFDELPLASLLDAERCIDAEHCIDAELYPHFAALAATATWYRNASTVWSHTQQSIVSMLTGTIAGAEPTVTLAHHPDNLLTWLRESHAIDASEAVTRLAPPGEQRAEAVRVPRAARLRAVARDVGVVYAHRVLPPVYAATLPAIDSRWAGFGATRARAESGVAWKFAVPDGRDRDFAAFLDRLGRLDHVDHLDSGAPPFHFQHVMLPHLPARFLPSGKVYGGRAIYRPPDRAWREDEQYAVEVYKRHLLQVGFVDRLLGDLIAHLRATGLFERTLLIVTSDHGASHWPGYDRRAPGATPHPDDILRVPLLIKLPGQHAGAVRDDNVQTVDIAPTVAGVLGVALPWSHGGRSLLDESAPPPPAKTLCSPEAGCVAYDGAFAPDPATLARKLALFDPARGAHRWAAQGPWRDLVGRAAADLPAAPAAPCVAELDQLEALRAYDAAGRYAPARWTGVLRCDLPLPAGAQLAIATRGHIRAVTEPRRLDGETLFSVLFSDRLLRAGDNRPAIYVVTGEDPARPVLAPTTLRGPRAG